MTATPTIGQISDGPVAKKYPNCVPNFMFLSILCHLSAVLNYGNCYYGNYLKTNYCKAVCEI